MKKVYPDSYSDNDCLQKFHITDFGSVAFHSKYRISQYFPIGSHKPIILVDGIPFDPSVDYTVYHPLELSLNFDYE